MNRVDRGQQGGFTIIELMVAMAFVSVLMLSIAVAVIQIGNIYNRGLTMRSVDYAGRALSTDIRQTLAKSEPFNVDTALRFQKNPDSDPDNPDGGRFCTGLYSYVWNFGKSIKDPVNQYSLSDEEIRFAKVRDPGGDYCADPTRKIQRENATELLSGGDRDLAVQKFGVSKLADDIATGQALYRIVMEIGTNNQNALQGVDSLNSIAECRPPSDDAALQDYCAVNLFEFTVQAGNGGDL